MNGVVMDFTCGHRNAGLSIMSWFETKNRVINEIEPKHKVTLCFRLKVDLPLKPKF